MLCPVIALSLEHQPSRWHAVAASVEAAPLFCQRFVCTSSIACSSTGAARHLRVCLKSCDPSHFEESDYPDPVVRNAACWDQMPDNVLAQYDASRRKRLGKESNNPPKKTSSNH